MPSTEGSNAPRRNAKKATSSRTTKKPSSRARSGGKAPAGGSATDGEAAQPSPRELIVVAERDVGLRAGANRPSSLSGADVSDLAEVLDGAGTKLTPLFGVSEDHLVAAALDLRTELDRNGGQAADADIPDLSVFYRVEAPDDELDALCGELAGAGCVAAAYVKPGAEPPAAPTLEAEEVEAPGRTALPASANWQSHQGYLGPAPAGVNALWAHTQGGGRGAGVRIVDVEGAWQLGHEDLQQHLGGVISGSQSVDIGWRNHGTAVIGVYGGDTNGFGITGIAPDADCFMSSIFGGGGTARAIRDAADRLGAGDIILLELHRPGPRHNFASRLDQRGYIAIEWWPDDYAAVRYAVSRGVIVVGAAGNGAENLDDGLYDVNPGFPASWRNPFDPANPSSGAVVVGAGAPPPGTHGRNHGDDRSRLGFSNHGRRVDAQGWGREVTTTGGRGGSPGDLQGGSDETLWYTDTFSGTSSASPVVVGSLACIQGILRARGQTLLTPASAIAILRSTGSPQQDGPAGPATQRIGNRPDIRAAVDALAPAVQQGVATRYWLELLAYPAGTARSLWLLVNGSWRHFDNPTPIQQDQVQRAFIDGTDEVRVWFEGAKVVGLVVNGT